MKKISVIVVLILISFNFYSQRIYTPDEYTQQSYKNNVISITFDPAKLGIGLIYISKPIIELTNPISFMSSIEYGKYSSILLNNNDVKILKVGLGPSIIIRNFNFNLMTCFNFLKTDIKEKLAEPISLEIGGTVKVEKLYYSIMADPINWEMRIGIGFGF